MNNEQQLRELDLKPSIIYLSLVDADLGTTFSQKLEANAVTPGKRLAVSTRCTDFLKEPPGPLPNVFSCIHGDAAKIGVPVSHFCCVQQVGSRVA